jgi:cytochrome c peroxidase
MKKTNYAIIALSALLFACSDNKKESAENLEAKEHERYDATLATKMSFFKKLPAKAENAENPLSAEKIKLGHVLYYDTRLSKDGNISCNSCHNLSTFGVDRLPTSPGDKGENGDRNSPTVLNAALHTTQFWDSRAKDVEQQAGMPIMNPVEMAIPSEKFLEDRLKGIGIYQELFKTAYPEQTNPITYKNLQNAIAAFERTLLTPSRFDKYLEGETTALTLEEKKGMLSFVTVGCTQCHSGDLLGGRMNQKFGVHDDYWKYTKSTKIDEGLYAITKNETDKYVFKVPSLRNIAETYPYFHDGSVADLKESVIIMAKVQLNNQLTEKEADNIVAFLKTLTGEVPAVAKTIPSELASK